MSYRASSTVYGNKTTSQIAALTGMQVGDTVFNTDYGQVEFYSIANVWTSNNSVILTASTTISEGQLVNINTSGQAGLLSNGVGAAQFGIGVCQYGGTAGSNISVRICGIAKCLVATSGVTRGDYGLFSSTAGSMTRTTSPSTGAIGRVLQTQTSGNLAYVFLTFLERA